MRASSRPEAARRLILAMALLALPARAASPLPAGSLYEDTFRWTDDTGARVELSDFRGRTVVVSMFYSNCSTLCMTTLGKLQEIESMFGQRNIDADFVLVSYDSSLDTPRQLARFRERHRLSPARWHLLSGPRGSVRRFAKRIGLGNYVDLGEHIAHSFRILVLDENGVARNGLDPWHAKVAQLLEPAPAPSVESPR